MTMTRKKIAASVSLMLMLVAGTIWFLSKPSEMRVIVIPAVHGGQR